MSPSAEYLRNTRQRGSRAQWVVVEGVLYLSEGPSLRISVSKLRVEKAISDSYLHGRTLILVSWLLL